MKNLITALIIMCCSTVQASDCVVLLHGLARTSASMEKLEQALFEVGYFVVNHDYPSRAFDIQTLAAKEIPIALAKCPEASLINFVTHSLGGIVLRQYLNENAIDRLGRTVMLGPPNQGSQVTDTLKNVPGYKLINGPAGMQLGTDSASVPVLLGKANFEVGIIAGTRSINLILSTMLPNPDDGKVSVESTKLEGMADHLSVPVSHPFLMKDDTVIKQVILFLQEGYFKHND